MEPFSYSDVPANMASLAIARKLEALHAFDYLCEQDTATNAGEKEEQRDLMLARSAAAAARIAGSAINEERLRLLIAGKTSPAGKVECEATGHVYVLDLIENRYDSLAVSPGAIMQLHRDFLFFQARNAGGKWRTAADDAAISPKPKIIASDIPWFMRSLCRSFAEGGHTSSRDPLVLAAMFVCDFLRISPFAAYNDRIAVFLLYELLLKAGWTCVTATSLEEAILANAQRWQDTAAQSSVEWPDKGDYLPFVMTVLETVEQAFQALAQTRSAREQARTAEETAPAPAIPPAAASPETKPAEPSDAPAEPVASAIPTAAPTDAEKSPETVSQALAASPARKPAHRGDREGNANVEILRAYFATVTEPVSKADILAANSSMSQKTVERILQKLQRDGTIVRVGAARATRYRAV